MGFLSTPLKIYITLQLEYILEGLVAYSFNPIQGKVEDRREIETNLVYKSISRAHRAIQ